MCLYSPWHKGPLLSICSCNHLFFFDQAALQVLQHCRGTRLQPDVVLCAARSWGLVHEPCMLHQGNH